jgi:hypothetical protein
MFKSPWLPGEMLYAAATHKKNKKQHTPASEACRRFQGIPAFVPVLLTASQELSFLFEIRHFLSLIAAIYTLADIPDS